MKISICAGAYKDKDVYYHLNKIKEHGFQALEYYNLYELEDPKHVAKELERLDLVINATCNRYFNLVDASKQERFLAALKETIEDCKVVGVRSIISQTGDVIPGMSREQHIAQIVETLKRGAELCEQAGIVLELEPLNEYNHPGNFLQRSDEAAAIIKAVGSEHVSLVFDVYHQQVTEGNVINNAMQYLPQINHFHIADNPGRQQPGTGELNYIHILQAIENSGFDGFVGLEGGYTKDTDIALDEFKSNILSKVVARV